MKRFYSNATVAPVEAEGGKAFGINLDTRPVNTPSRHRLAVPTRALALAIAEEWNAQDEKIDVRAMRQTGLANAAIDRVGADRKAFIDTLAQYGETDLLYYRAENPDPLIKEQAESWNPILDWMEREHKLTFTITKGVGYVAQPPETLAALRRLLGESDDFTLAALNPIVTIGGSLVAAQALAHRAFAPDDIWDAVTLDERWQERQWGVDDEARAMIAARKIEWDAAVAFLDRLG